MPNTGERLTSTPIIVVTPFVDEFVDDKQTHPVGNTGKRFAIGIMGTTDAVIAKGLSLKHQAFDTTIEGCYTQATHVVMVCHTLQEHLTAIEFEAEIL